MSYKRVKEWEWCTCVEMHYPKCNLCNVEGKILVLNVRASLNAAEAEIKRLTTLLEEKPK